MINPKILLLLLLIYLGICALNIEEYPQYELETPEVIFQEIEQTDKQNHPQIPKLFFITPWNHQGKRLTVKYAKKIKYVSPCWYELIIKNGQIVFENDQLVDHGYLQQIKKANSEIKIIPRVYVNNFEVFRQIGARTQSFEKAINLIIKVVKDKGFEGIVWDSPYDLFNADPQMTSLNNLICQFVNQLKYSFRHIQSSSQLLLFFNVANPSKSKLDNKLYESLDIDGLLIQNYDSPLDFIQILKNSVQWVQQINPKAKQIIMMLPFFSYKNGQGMSTVDAKKQLQKNGIFSSGFERSMCKFISDKKRKYLIPCFKYFSQAFQIISQSQYSAGFWQGGNGLQNFYLFL